MSKAKSMKLPEIKKELLKILSDLESEGQKIFEQKQEENYKCQKALNDRIAELEAELAKRPVVYCLRDAKTGLLEKTGQSPDIYTLHHAKQWSPRSYTYEPYTGQTS